MEKYRSVEQDRNDNIKVRMRLACWIAKSTDTLLQYVILLDFPLLQQSYERSSMLRYIYIACIANSTRN